MSTELEDQFLGCPMAMVDILCRNRYDGGHYGAIKLPAEESLTMEIWRVQSFNLNGTVFSTEAFDTRVDAEAAYLKVSVGAYKRLAMRTVGTKRFQTVAEAKVSAKGVKVA